MKKQFYVHPLIRETKAYKQHEEGLHHANLCSMFDTVIAESMRLMQIATVQRHEYIKSLDVAD